MLRRPQTKDPTTNSLYKISSRGDPFTNSQEILFSSFASVSPIIDYFARENIRVSESRKILYLPRAKYFFYTTIAKTVCVGLFIQLHRFIISLHCVILQRLFRINKPWVVWVVAPILNVSLAFIWTHTAQNDDTVKLKATEKEVIHECTVIKGPKWIQTNKQLKVVNSINNEEQFDAH